MLTSVSLVVPEYESSVKMISVQIRTSQRVVAVHHFFTVAFLTPFFVCGMLGKPYHPDGGSHCHGKFRGVFCKNICPLSEGCVCICLPL